MAKKTILVVDDETHIVEMMTTFLSLKGYDVRGAHTGQSGLALALADPPDALLLDLMLPDLDGFEVCRQLRDVDELAHVPVLIISARTDPLSKQRAEDAGADAYFTKPVAMPQLISELEALLARAEVVRTESDGGTE